MPSSGSTGEGAGLAQSWTAATGAEMDGAAKRENVEEVEDANECRLMCDDDDELANIRIT